MDAKTLQELTAENERLRAALSEVAEGRGAYSRDQLTFANNVIEQAKHLANVALGREEPND